MHDGASAPPGQTIHGLFERQAQARPEAVAVRHGDQSVTYASLRARATWWTSRLIYSGVRPGDLVGVHLDREPDLVAAMLGVLKTGAGYVPLDPAYPRDRILYMLQDAGVAAVITRDEGLRAHSGAAAVLFPDAAHRVSSHPPDGVLSGGHVAYVLYTSGSTGTPKGVPMTHDNAVDMLVWAGEVFGADLDSVLASTSVCFDCSILEIFGPLAHGGTTVLVNSVMDMATRPDGWGVRLLHSVPSVIEELLRSDRLPKTVRTAIVGGEALWAALVRQIYARSSIERLVNLYGPTEYTSYATMAVIPRQPQPSAAAPPIGRPVANTSVYLLDADGSQVPADEPGEICLSGAGLAQGYLRRPGLTAHRFVPDPFAGRPGERMYRTGDLGAWGDDGELQFLGRLDDQVKVRGVRIEPTEVEHALLSHPAVREAVVTVTGASPGSAMLTAYLVADLPESTGSETLRAYLRDRVPSALVPGTYLFLRQLPRMPNGKVDRRRLPAPRPQVSCASAEPARAPSHLETVLAQMWAEAAGVERVDPDTDVFTLGGHSLPALRVRTKVAQQLGADLPLRIFFEQPTVAALAAEISRLQPDLVAVPTAVIPVPRSGGRELGITQAAILRRADRGDDGLALPLVVRLHGPLVAPALRWAAYALASRHDMLHARVSGTSTGLHWTDAEPPRLMLADLRGVTPDAAEAAASRAVERMLARPWDPRAEPPMRALVVRLAEDDHVVGIGLHAIAADAWTVETISHQILELYAAAVGATPLAAAPVVQYADWVAHANALLASPDGQRQRRHWRELLAGAPILRLPGDARRLTRPAASNQRIFLIEPDTVDRLTRLARREAATPYMALVAAVAATLHQHCGQPEIMIGCPTSGRLRSELSTMVGPCMDALVLRCDVAGNPDYVRLLRHVRDRALTAYANDAVPFVEMAATTGEQPGRHPLFQASVVLQQPPSLLDPSYSAELARHQAIGNLTLSGFLELPPATALDVELAFFERDGGWEGVLDCRGDVVSPEEADELAEAFGAAIRAAAHATHGASTAAAGLGRR